MIGPSCCEEKWWEALADSTSFLWPHIWFEGSQPTWAICIAWLLLRSHILAVLSQEAVNTLLPSWLKRTAHHKLFYDPAESIYCRAETTLHGKTYITPARIQNWTCVHLLGFRDSLSIVLHLPAPDLNIRRYSRIKLCELAFILISIYIYLISYSSHISCAEVVLHGRQAWWRHPPVSQLNSNPILKLLSIVFHWNELLTSLAQDPPMRKFPGIVGGLKARQLMLSSGGEVTSTSCGTRQRHKQQRKNLKLSDKNVKAQFSPSHQNNLSKSTLNTLLMCSSGLPSWDYDCLLLCFQRHLSLLFQTRSSSQTNSWCINALPLLRLRDK